MIQEFLNKFRKKKKRKDSFGYWWDVPSEYNVICEDDDPDTRLSWKDAYSEVFPKD